MPTNYDESGRAFIDCRNPACMAKIKEGTVYCCGGCSEANGKYDADGYHSQSCMMRQAVRGQWEGWHKPWANRKPDNPSDTRIGRSNQCELDDHRSCLGMFRNRGDEIPCNCHCHQDLLKNASDSRNDG